MFWHCRTKHVFKTIEQEHCSYSNENKAGNAFACSMENQVVVIHHFEHEKD